MKPFLVIICIQLFFLAGSIVADDVNIRKVQPLETDCKLDATLESIKGERNHTLHISSISNTGERKEILTEKNVQYFFIKNEAKYLFFRTYIGGGKWPGLNLYDGINGRLLFLGNYPTCDVSDDGRTLFSYVPKEEGEIAGAGVLYEVPSMREIARYNFSLALKDKYSAYEKIGNYSIGLVYNAEVNGFEILFNQYEELGKLTCTGVITLSDKKFKFTDRKNELLKIMGYNR